MIDIASSALIYVVLTFPLGFVWHLALFKERYRSLEIYRENVSPPLGLSSMLIQGIAFGFMYAEMFASAESAWFMRAAGYALTGGFLSWSFTTLAWAAKGRVTSLREFFALETAFTVVQWILVGLATALLIP